MEGSAQKLEEAYQEYIKRQSRESHPEGKTDGGGRWYPSEEEEQPCCRHIREPSRRFPWSLMTHCRTMRHVANLHGVAHPVLRTLYHKRKERKPPKREGGDRYYKAVRVGEDGRMTSLYERDGKALEYRIGETVEETARQGHNGGVYVYASVGAARDMAERVYGLRGAEYAVLRCECEGSYCVYGDYQLNRKLAFSRVTPLEVVG